MKYSEGPGGGELLVGAEGGAAAAGGGGGGGAAAGSGGRRGTRLNVLLSSVLGFSSLSITNQHSLCTGAVLGEWAFIVFPRSG